MYVGLPSTAYFIILYTDANISSLVHFHLTSSGLSGILSALEAAEFPFFLDPLEGTETSPRSTRIV
jgi:hypothetical protein